MVQLARAPAEATGRRRRFKAKSGRRTSRTADRKVLRYRSFTGHFSPSRGKRTMNRFHKWYCRSGHWKRKIQDEILPWTLRDLELGDSVLEIGPGPGVTTDYLRNRVKDIECLEVDPALASSLGDRVVGTNVHVQHGNATAMPYRDGSFSAVVSFTMLHHVPSISLQNQLFVEAHRVLRPGGIFAGVTACHPC
jgi:SAM-dependent methyltransferase